MNTISQLEARIMSLEYITAQLGAVMTEAKLLDTNTVDSMRESFTHKLHTLPPEADKSSAFETFEQITAKFTRHHH